VSARIPPGAAAGSCAPREGIANDERADVGRFRLEIDPGHRRGWPLPVLDKRATGRTVVERNCGFAFNDVKVEADAAPRFGLMGSPSEAAPASGRMIIV